AGDDGRAVAVRLARRRFLTLLVGAAAGTTAACSESPPASRLAADPTAPAPPGHGPRNAAQLARPAPKKPTYPNATVAENARVGDPNWQITDAGPAHAIEGYADRVSVLPGQPFGLYVSTSARAYRINAYRIGWYDGAGARLVWRSAQLPGHRQASPTVTPGVRMVRAPWQRGTVIDTTNWPEGCYLLRLDAVGRSGQQYVPLTIRSSSAHDRTVIMNAQPTWQAYNQWGGYSLYTGPYGGLADRSLLVTFDRPYSEDLGAGQFLAFEQPLVRLAERLGLSLAYLAATDVAAEPSVLDGARSVLSLGHDEYWSPQRRRHVTVARDAGTNLAILGANCCYRRVRLASSPLGSRRVIICYKGDWNLDPGVRHGDPPTANYRDSPRADPESRLDGVIYEGFPVDASYVITEPRHWVLTGTGARAGDVYPHLVGVEYDRVNPAYPTPHNIDVFAHSPVDCSGTWSFSDSAYYSTGSGAGVFATGTMRWVDALRAHGPARIGRDHGIDGRTGQLVETVTTTVLREFSRGPAGLVHPAHGSARRIYGTI
ncbi:MAG: hypothetical protein J2P23_04590, partial [Microlunatus sp.]|nr:hypothetical protein [Microlunatus sp.]